MMETPASKLSGLTLDGVWEVGEKIERPTHATGGCFSIGYHATDSNGQRAYVKALDFEPIIRQVGRSAEAINQLTEAFLFERDLVRLCRSKNRVVSGFTDGETLIDGVSVPYIVFEKADADIRQHISHGDSFDAAWKLRVIHNSAVGLAQLHGSRIAHQDLKPSNVMLFGTDLMKLGDLGRAYWAEREIFVDDFDVAGDPTYAPPELLYGYKSPEWRMRRLGCDIYLLGSLAAYLFLGQGFTSLLKNELHPDHNWELWGGSYTEVLPYLSPAHEAVIARLKAAIPGSISGQLSTAIANLTIPDIHKRGDPISQARGAQFSLERYISLFDRLAFRARLGLR